MNSFIICKVGDTFPDLAQKIGDFEQWIAHGIGQQPIPVHIIDPRTAAGLPAANEVAGVIVSGSHAMVTEQAPWSEALAVWLRELVKQRIPVLGICYGHQLLAHAMGGEVDYHPDGIEVGTVMVRCTEAAADDALFHGLPPEFPAQVVHRQSVRRLPDGAVRLAGNDFEQNQAFRVGESAWGLQFHPEFSSHAMTAYIAHLTEDLHAGGKDVQALLARVAPTAVAASLLQQYATVVQDRQRSSDRPYRPALLRQEN